MDISISGKWEGKRGARKGRPTSRAIASRNRAKRREEQEIIFNNDPYLNYRKSSFGKYILPKHLWNEGFDFANKSRNASRDD